MFAAADNLFLLGGLIALFGSPLWMPASIWLIHNWWHVWRPAKQNRRRGFEVKPSESSENLRESDNAHG